MHADEDRYDDQPAALTVAQRVAAIIAVVLGGLGSGWGLLSLASIALTGAMGTNQIAAGQFGGGAWVPVWLDVSFYMGAIIAVVGMITSLLAVATGLAALFARRLGPLRWTAALIVVFDLIAYVLWPLISSSVGMFALNGMPQDLMPFVIGSVVFFGLISLVFSLLLVAFWVWTFFQMRSRNVASEELY